MKNKKPKTIKEVVQSYDISEDWEGMYREIKQLIADEVIALKTNHINPNCLDSGCCNNHGETGSVTYDLKRHEKQQLKNLERL